MESTRAILIRKHALTESSLIVNWISEDGGKLRTAAKGARRKKSAFAGKLDLFFDCEIQIVRSRKSQLHSLTEVVLHDTNDALRSSYARIRAASYFAALLDLATEDDHPAPGLYSLMQRALGFLSHNEPTLKAVKHFEVELCKLLGIMGGAPSDFNAAVAIEQHCGRLPKDRKALLANLT